jgi:purine nucleosidase
MVTLVPWETIVSHSLPLLLIQELIGGESSRAALFRRTISRRFIEQTPGQRVLFEPDPLAVAVALEPEIVQRAENRYVEIELAGRLTRGQAVIDWYDLTGRPHNAELVLEIDRGRFVELLKLSLE